MHSIGDDLSWSHGKHAFKGRYEFRQTQSNGFNDPNYDPVVTLGAGTSTQALLDATPANGGFTGLTTNAATATKGLAAIAARNARTSGRPPRAEFAAIVSHSRSR